LSITETTNLYS